MTVIKRKIESTPLKYVKYSEAKQGDTLVIGDYLGSPMVDNYDKTDKVPQHQFNTDEGLVALNSAGQLNYLLKKVEVGQTVEIIFLGKEKTTINGKKVSVNNFEVSILEGE